MLDDNAMMNLDYSSSLEDVWRILSKRERTILREDAKVVNFSKNEVIYSVLEQPTHLMCLLKGSVKISIDGVGGRSQIIRIIRPVQYFGYRASFAAEAYRTSAAAFENSQVAMVPMNVIIDLIRANSNLALFFIKQLSIDLGISDERIVSLTQKHIRGRLAESILFLKDTHGLEEDGATLSIYLAREDLANLSNMTTSNAIRTLSTFVSEKLIAIDGRKVKIIDEEQLHRISKLG